MWLCATVTEGEVKLREKEKESERESSGYWIRRTEVQMQVRITEYGVSGLGYSAYDKTGKGGKSATPTKENAIRRRC